MRAVDFLSLGVTSPCRGTCSGCAECQAPTSTQALNSIFERLRSILHEGTIDKRVQYMIEGLYSKRKDNFAAHPAIQPQLDLVESDDQVPTARSSFLPIAARPL